MGKGFPVKILLLGENGQAVFFRMGLGMPSVPARMSVEGCGDRGEVLRVVGRRTTVLRENVFPRMSLGTGDVMRDKIFPVRGFA